MKKLFLILILSCLPFLLSDAHSVEKKLSKSNFNFLQEQDPYYILRAKAAREGIPLLVWVKSIPRRFGYLNFETDEDKYFGVTGPNLIVGVPYKKDLYVIVLPYTSTKSDVDAAIKKSVEDWSKTFDLDILGIKSGSQTFSSQPQSLTVECRT